MTRNISTAERSFIRFAIGADLARRRGGRRKDNDDDSADWFRETHNRRLKRQPILKGDRQDAIVSTLKAWFSTARFSAFQFEGDSRASLRQMLIKEGHAWQSSDDEAHRLIQIAFREMGAVRPSIAEGQQEWTVQEWCGFCCGPLDEEAIARRDRYCCVECARSARGKRWQGKTAGFFGGVAYRQIRREELPERECKHCSRLYRPNTTTITDSENRQYCSIRCWGTARRTLPDITCENPGCRNVFRPRGNGFRFCSHRCSVEGRSLILPIRNCGYCDTPFQPTHETSIYCSDLCNNRAKTRRKGERRREARQDRTCLHCRSIFTPKSALGKFCSDRCTRNASYHWLKASRA